MSQQGKSYLTTQESVVLKSRSEEGERESKEVTRIKSVTVRMSPLTLDEGLRERGGVVKILN